MDKIKLPYRKVKFEDYPLYLRNEVLKKMIYLNNIHSKNDKPYFPLSIQTSKALEDYIQKNNYDVNKYFQCYTLETITDFCIISKFAKDCNTNEQK